MNDRNRYAPPQAKLTQEDEVDEYGEISLFSTRGRLGRIRYIGYTTGLTVLVMIALGAVATIGLGAETGVSAAQVAIIVGYVAGFAITLLLSIQRAHDMNVSGWLALIVFVPLAGLIFWFVPGSRGANNYGKPPPPNTIGVILLACLLPLIAILGIVAAIAIPAYQDYARRAAESTPTEQIR